MTPEMTPEEILARAADLIDAGWCQRQYRLENPRRYCLVGALGEVCGQRSLSGQRFSSAFRITMEAAIKEIGGQALTYWNDTPGRTAIEVSTILRNAKRHLQP